MNGTYFESGCEKSARESVPSEGDVQPESKWWTGGQSLESVSHNNELDNASIKTKGLRFPN